MAKKQSGSREGINVTQEVLGILESNPKLTTPEVRAALSKKYPDAIFNPNSLGVAFSKARGKLGISDVRRSKAVKRAAKKRASGAAPKAKRVKRKKARRQVAVAQASGLSQLKLAREFVSQCGGAKAAIAAIQELEELQL